MTPSTAPSMVRVAPARVLCVVRTRVRYIVRSRVGLVALLLAVLPWFALDRHDADAELGLLTGSSLIGLLVTASGAVAENLDDGSYGIGVLHGLAPLDALLGEAFGALVGLVPVALAFAFLSAPVLGNLEPAVLVLALAWLGVLLLGWLGVMLFLGTVLPGKGNAVAMIPLFFAFAFPADSLPLDSWPPLFADAARTSWNAMPLQSHAAAMYAALLHDATPPPAAPFALLVAPPVFLALAAIRLSRLEAAGRLTQ